MMRKILFSITTVLSLMCHSEAMLVESYAKEAYKFGPDTDLICGHILLSESPLKIQRFKGDIHYFYEPTKRYDGNSCSFLDVSSSDPMADLLIQLFPSAGIQLNAQGTGAIAFVPAKLTDFIAGMFFIDIDVRRNKSDSEVFQEIAKIDEAGEEKTELMKRFVKTSFKLSHGSSSFFERLFRLAKNIANAVMLERDETMVLTTDAAYKNMHPYPPKYTNYLICAYAWSALSTDKLDELARKLGYTEISPRYNSELTSKILTEMREKPSLMPFYAGQQIITNSITEYNGYKFADCVETTMRQFFATLLCSAVINEEEKFTGELTVALDRIPANATELRTFFAPGGISANIRELANDGSPEVRKAWAEVISGHQAAGISYVSTNHEMYGGWSNMIKVFCFLMQDYVATQDGPSTPRKLAAQNCIKAINEAVRNGEFFISSSEELLEIINDLIGIRTDVTLIAEEGHDENLKVKDSDVEGEILIYPESHEKGNELRFYSTKIHAQLFSIARAKSTGEVELSPSTVTLPWIEQLYNNRELAITGKPTPYESLEYPSIFESNYPLLDFYMRIGGNIRVEWLFATLREMLNTPHPHTEAIARLFFDENSFESELCLSGLLKKADEIPMQALLNIIQLAATHSKSTGNAAIAMQALNERIPEKASCFRKDISGTSSNFDLVTQRMAFGRWVKTDPILKRFIQTHEFRECILVLSDVVRLYEYGPMANVPIFEESMMETLIPHAEKAIEQFKTGEIEEIYMYGVPLVLDFIDWENIDPRIVEAINRIRQATKENPHFLLLRNNFNRSQKKLELLLPISYAENTAVADKIFNDCVGHVTPEIVASIIMNVSAEHVAPLLSKMSKKEDAIQLINELVLMRDTDCVCEDVYMHNCARLKKIVEAIQIFGKIDKESALKLMDLFQRLTFIAVASSEPIPDIKNILFKKFDATTIRGEKCVVLLTLFNLFPSEIMNEEFQAKFNDVGSIFFEIFAECSEEERKAMSDSLILKISENFETLSNECYDPEWCFDTKDILVEELERRSTITATEKQDLIEKLRSIHH